jgi:hypothetical protein
MVSSEITQRGRGRPKSGLTKKEMAVRSRKNTDTKTIAANGEILKMLRQLQAIKLDELGVELTLKQMLQMLLTNALAAERGRELK